MPTYVYACTECGHQFEAHQSFSDASLTECPNCSGKLRKVFNSVGIVFKGSGFYRNDSREKATGSAAAESGSSDKLSEKSSDKSSDKASEKSSDKPSEKSSDKVAAKSESSSSGAASSSGSSSSSSSSSGSGSAT